ncbi:1-phosphatidylinositol 4,5-bisphosphate phosphodiesterase gamma plc-3, partial [Clarias magur]
PSPFNSSICTQNLTCNNASQFFEELIEVLDKIKVDELSENATRTLEFLKENVKDVINSFRNGHTMK